MVRRGSSCAVCRRSSQRSKGVGAVAFVLVEFLPKRLIAIFGAANEIPVFFGLNGVLYSMPVSDILTFVIAAFLIRGTYRELAEKQIQKK